MGRRGPAPKPSALKRMQGTARRDRANPHEPQPALASVEAPAWLTSPVAVAEWRRVAAELRHLGLLTVLDVALLGAYCEAFGQWRHAEEATAEADAADSKLYATVAGIAAKRRAELQRLGAEFGFSPAARSRVHAPAMPEAKGKLLRYLRKPGNDDDTGAA